MKPFFTVRVTEHLVEVVQGAYGVSLLGNARKLWSRPLSLQVALQRRLDHMMSG